MQSPVSGTPILQRGRPRTISGIPIVKQVQRGRAMTMNGIPIEGNDQGGRAMSMNGIPRNQRQNTVLQNDQRGLFC